MSLLSVSRGVSTRLVVGTQSWRDRDGSTREGHEQRRHRRIGDCSGARCLGSTGDSDQRRATITITPADSNRPGASTTPADTNERVAKPIRITKVSYDPPGPDSGSSAHLNREWFAIKSSGQRTRQLRGWTLWDASGHVFHFPQFRLRPDTAVTVHTGDGR